MRVAKWGNSLAVRLPKDLVDEMGLKEGDDVAIVPAGDKCCGIETNRRREEALARMAERRWVLPVNYRFDREEANER